MADKEWKLNYKIGERRPLTVRRNPGMNSNGPCSPGTVAEPDIDMDQVTVEWTHKDGFPPDMREISILFTQVDFVLNCILLRAVQDRVLDAKQSEDIRAISRKVFKPHHMRPDLGILTVPDGERKVIVDQLNVKAGTPNSIIAMQCEEKRAMLAQAIGVEP